MQRCNDSRGRLGSPQQKLQHFTRTELDAEVWFPRVADHLRRVPLRALRMCLGEVGDYAEFERLFVEEQDGAQLTAEMAFARSHPGTRARLSIAKISLTLGSWTSDL